MFHRLYIPVKSEVWLSRWKGNDLVNENWKTFHSFDLIMPLSIFKEYRTRRYICYDGKTEKKQLFWTICTTIDSKWIIMNGCWSHSISFVKKKMKLAVGLLVVFKEPWMAYLLYPHVRKENLLWRRKGTTRKCTFKIFWLFWSGFVSFFIKT